MDKVVRKDFSNKEKSVIYSIVRYANRLYVEQGALSEAGRKIEFSLVAYEGKLYDKRVDMRRMCAAMDDLVFLYGLSDMIERGIELIRCFNPKKGKIYGEIIRRYFCSEVGNTDEDVIDMLSEWIRRRQYYREKKEAIRWMGYYFFEVILPEMRKKRDVI